MDRRRLGFSEDKQLVFIPKIKYFVLGMLDSTSGPMDLQNRKMELIMSFALIEIVSAKPE